MIGVPPSGGSLVVSFFTFEKRKAKHDQIDNRIGSPRHRPGC